MINLDLVFPWVNANSIDMMSKKLKLYWSPKAVAGVDDDAVVLKFKAFENWAKKLFELL